MINQISKFIGKFMGLVFGPENHTSHVNLDKPIELRNVEKESIKALKEIKAFNHDSLKTPMPKPVQISEPIKDEPIKNEHVQEKTNVENQSEPIKLEPSNNGNKQLTFAEKIELIRSKRIK